MSIVYGIFCVQYFAWTELWNPEFLSWRVFVQEDRQKRQQFAPLTTGCHSVSAALIRDSNATGH